MQGASSTNGCLLLQLPPEVALHIIEQLDADDVSSIARSCECISQLCRSHRNLIWMAISERRWSFTPNRDSAAAVDWKRYYFERTLLDRDGSFKWSVVNAKNKPTPRMCHTGITVSITAAAAALPETSVSPPPSDGPMAGPSMSAEPNPDPSAGPSSRAGRKRARAASASSWASNKQQQQLCDRDVVVYLGGQSGQTNRFNDVFVFDGKTFSAVTPQMCTSPALLSPVVDAESDAEGVGGIGGAAVTPSPVPMLTNDNSNPSPVLPKFSRHTTVAIGGRVFSFGGYDGVGTYFGLAVLEPNAMTWTNPATSGAIPPFRTNHAAAAIGSKMYVYGGNSTHEGHYRIYDDLYVLDSETMHWSRPKVTGPAPGPRVAHKMVAIGNKVYMFGGGVWSPSTEWTKKFNALHILDTETMSWSCPEPAPTSLVRSCSFCIPFVHSSFLFIYGGQSILDGQEVDDLVSFDTVSLTWKRHTCGSPQPRNPGPRSVASANVFPRSGCVYMFGGSSTFQLENSVHKLKHPIFRSAQQQQPRPARIGRALQIKRGISGLMPMFCSQLLQQVALVLNDVSRVPMPSSM
jgi:hypothetical protein